MLEKPKLFLTLKEFWWSMAFLLTLLSLRLFFLYQSYEAFTAKPFYYSEVQVIQAYEKWKDDEYHTILKVYSPTLDLNFFSRTKIRVEEIHDRLRLKLYPSKEMKFTEYLGTSFIASRVNEVYKEESGTKNSLMVAIAKQHDEPLVSNFYQAIFLATPLSRELRDKVSALGVSHLIALSGFHLAILSGLLFFFIRLIYRPMQQRFFPYRFDLFDIGFMVLLILAWYVWFVDAPPSLVRSYAMMLVGWLLLVFGIELISFTFLVTTVLLLLIIFPKMLLSMAFWFSVLGVFYIFLILHYFSHLNRYLITLLISFGIFILMLPIVHLVFPMVSFLQLFSPFLSLLFSIFYPLSMGLHLLGFGDLFDGALKSLFSFTDEVSMFKLPLIYGIAYLLLSLGAIFSKKAFYLLVGVALFFSMGLFIGFWV